MQKWECIWPVYIATGWPTCLEQSKHEEDGKDENRGHRAWKDTDGAQGGRKCCKF